jgi:hypothetical protein
MSKTYKAEANPDRVRAAQNRLRSSAAGVHGDRRLGRLRTRGNIKVSLRKEAVSA